MDIYREVSEQYQGLFNLMSQEYNLILTISEMDEIIIESQKVVDKISSKKETSAVLLDVELVVGDNTALLIKYPTGIKYEVQAGGLSCTHPTCEGFCINIGKLGQDFNDCSYGCAWIDKDEEKQKSLAKDLEKYLEEKTKNLTFQIRFDYDRLEELQEGWWPVLVTGRINGGIIATKDVIWEGYVHPGNCD